MAYKRKYRKGEQITSLDELSKQEFIYFRHKVTHCGWFMSWQLQTTKKFMELGYLYYAEKVDDKQ
jgi:hypothetical protein